VFLQNERIFFFLLLNCTTLHICSTLSLSILQLMDNMVAGIFLLLWIVQRWILRVQVSLCHTDLIFFVCCGFNSQACKCFASTVPLNYIPNLDFISFAYVPLNGFAESYSSSIFYFLRKFHAVFHNGFMNLHYFQHPY
jgi:hypothetical protein